MHWGMGREEQSLCMTTLGPHLAGALLKRAGWTSWHSSFCKRRASRRIRLLLEVHTVDLSWKMVMRYLLQLWEAVSVCNVDLAITPHMTHPGVYTCHQVRVPSNQLHTAVESMIFVLQCELIRLKAFARLTKQLMDLQGRCRATSPMLQLSAVSGAVKTAPLFQLLHVNGIRISVMLLRVTELQQAQLHYKEFPK